MNAYKTIGFAGNSEFALHLHLMFNFDPPVVVGEELALAALQAAREGRWEDVVEDTLYPARSGRAREVVERWRLAPFLEWSP